MRRLISPALLAAVAVLAAAPAVASAAAPSPPAASKPAKPAKPAKSAKAAKKAKRGPVARASVCSAPMSGDWRNINPNTRSMTRVVVDFTCGDVVLCPIGQPCIRPESFYSMNPFGKCHPTDCNWGRLRAYDMGDGWIRSLYNFGFATAHVWLKTYSYYGLTYLRVWVYTDFTPADGRTDYVTDEWMLR